MSEGYGGTQAPLFAQERPQSLERPLCKRPGCKKPLTGRQTDYCSKACNGAVYNAAHPRLNPPQPADKPRESTKARLLGVLHDREWWTLWGLSEKLGAQPQSVSARIRELRADGFVIQHRVAKTAYSRHSHEYRLIGP